MSVIYVLTRAMDRQTHLYLDHTARQAPLVPPKNPALTAAPDDAQDTPGAHHARARHGH